MRNLKTLACAVVILSPVAGAACPNMEGTWQSSKEKFVAFNKTWANVEERAWAYMLQTQGLEHIVFAPDGQMIIRTPGFELKMGERTIPRPSQEEKINFDVLGCTEKSIVIKYERYGSERISQLHFDSDDSYWVYMGTPGSDGNSHIREFYYKAD